MSEDVDWLSPGPDGTTPLAPEDYDSLKLDWVTTRGELNLVERDNIVKGLSRIKWRRAGAEQLLDDLTIRALHYDLFGDVWTWAGKYRANELNLGIDPTQISVAVRGLVADARVWFSGGTPDEVDLAVCRLHHRLVQIHPFRNGNGRLARAHTDLLVRGLDRAAFTWGSQTGSDVETARRAYLSALREADVGDLDPLRVFVRT